MNASTPRGRPRDRSIDDAVLDSTLAALDSAGYAALSLEAVAREAGTTKPSIYRRWPTRQHLVLTALQRRLGDAPAVPDTGCTLCDLDEAIKIYVAAFERMPPDVLGPLLADCVHDPVLRETFMAALFEPPRVIVGETLARAVRRGDLRADLDRDLIVDLIGSVVYFRAMVGEAAIGNAQVERVVETLLRGAAVDYDALVEHSRGTVGDSAMHRMHS